MKILTYNVNGIRSALSKGFGTWLAGTDADVVALQEIKASLDQFDRTVFEDLGYHLYWYPAEKKGYSGTAILSKQVPRHVEYGCGLSVYDCEGRVIRADFDDVSLMSVYMPSGSSGDVRQAFKMQWLDDFHGYVTDLQRSHPNLVISGDYNICHQPIDIHNPKANVNCSGFLPEERAWFGSFLSSGFVDAFRVFNADPHHYTWWSFRSGARQRNLGWRIDYHLATEPLRERLVRAAILPEAHHSDHCPVLVELT
jgi:exodeoxyribonuclease-3